MKRVLLVLLGVFAVLAGLLLLWQVESQEGYFSPVFSPDGQEIFFIVRQSRGLALGFGYEMLTPPAHVFIWKDRFSLRKMKVDERQVEEIKSWPPSPLEGRRIRAYHGGIFSSASTQLRWVEGNQLEYKIRVRIPSQPRAEDYSVQRVWDNLQQQMVERDEWSTEWVAVSGYDQSPLSEDREVIAARGEENYPCALVLREAALAAVTVLLKTPVCDEVYPAGITSADVEPLSHRKEIERIEDLNSTREKLLREARARGLSEGDAALDVIRRMEELGYYPRGPQWIARLLTPAEVESLRAGQALEPLVAISEMEFQVGLFQDIQKALEAPGTEVEKSGRYIIHRDYTTSQRLNELLASGTTQLYIERAGRIYELRVHQP